MQIPPKRRYKSKYDAQLKLSIVREYLTSDLGVNSLSKKYDVPASTIHDFIKWYREKYADQTVEPSPTQPNNQLDDKDLKITALQMLIENASKELGVDLVKKFGTKQSKK